jgi:hypothetical protein
MGLCAAAVISVLCKNGFLRQRNFIFAGDDCQPAKKGRQKASRDFERLIISTGFAIE